MSAPLTIEEISALKALYDAGSSGGWYVETGLMGKDLWITSPMREMNRGEDGYLGSIAHVSSEYVSSRSKRGHSGTTEIDRRPIKTARPDADLIVGAVNALPKLINALAEKGTLDEAAWLVEFTPDRHAPTRYWSAAYDQPVMAASEATRMSRKADAEAIIKAYGFDRKAKAVEHAWVAPRVSARPIPTDGDTL